jgi:formylglycine-generating enzyme required for sulfatase activity
MNWRNDMLQRKYKLIGVLSILFVLLCLSVLTAYHVHARQAILPPELEAKPEKPAKPEKMPAVRPSKPRPVATGTLLVNVEPSGAWIKVMTVGPKYSPGISVPVGTHKIVAGKSGYQSAVKYVKVSAGKQSKVSITLQSESSEASSASSASPSSAPRETWTDTTTGMEFVWVPGGSFEMGCGSRTSDCYDNEKPVHRVTLKGFWLGRYEVTQAQWQKVMGDNPSGFKKGGDYPVERVSWNQVQEFIKALNNKVNAKFRLPSEAEWEYACSSGGKAEKYSGGSDVGRVAWYDGNSKGSTQPVGRKDPNGLGLHDMSGNVREWVEDRWHGSYNDAPIDGSAWVSGGESDRVYRSGGSFYGSRDVRCAYRNRFGSDYGFSYLGFRLLRTD